VSWTLFIVVILNGGFNTNAMQAEKIEGFTSEKFCEEASEKIKATNSTWLKYCVRIK